MDFFGIPFPALFGQVLIGLINGSFYALLSLGLAIIFGLLRVVNFAHGAQYMFGAFVAWLLLGEFGLGYWWALLLSPLVVAAVGVVVERTMLQRLYRVDHLYSLMFTFGLGLVIQGAFLGRYGSGGQPYAIPPQLAGGTNLGFMFLPHYRVWVIVASVVACGLAWFLIERTRLGGYLRAATENQRLVQAFGVNVPRMLTLTYAAAVGIAAFAGVMAAPIYEVAPLMGTEMIIVVFAVVVIGGMGSVFGSIVAGFGLGLVEGLTKVFYPPAASVVVFVMMALVILVRPNGLFAQK